MRENEHGAESEETIQRTGKGLNVPSVCKRSNPAHDYSIPGPLSCIFDRLVDAALDLADEAKRSDSRSLASAAAHVVYAVADVHEAAELLAGGAEV